nr:GatB/YqeY domain-containing protein [Azospirillum oleiclasticum]
MITIEDCIALSGLTEEEIDAIAAHEHLPEIVATELGAYLEQTPQGRRTIRHMIEDDITAAMAARDTRRAGILKMVLAHYVRHQENQPVTREDDDHGRSVVA